MIRGERRFYSIGTICTGLRLRSGSRTSCRVCRCGRGFRRLRRGNLSYRWNRYKFPSYFSRNTSRRSSSIPRNEEIEFRRFFERDGVGCARLILCSARNGEAGLPLEGVGELYECESGVGGSQSAFRHETAFGHAGGGGFLLRGDDESVGNSVGTSLFAVVSRDFDRAGGVEIFHIDGIGETVTPGDDRVGFLPIFRNRDFSAVLDQKIDPGGL